MLNLLANICYYYHIIITLLSGVIRRNRQEKVIVKIVIEESMEGKSRTPGMLLSPKRLITYFYPLLLRYIAYYDI